MPNDLHLNIVTRAGAGLATPEEGRRLMALQVATVPEATPVKCGYTEPLTVPWSLDGVAAVWYEPFMWRGARGAEGMVSQALHENERGWITASFDRSVVAEASLVTFSRKIEREFGIEFGFVHTPVRGSGGEFALTVTNHDLRRYLPDVYWGTVFGPAYVELFGRNRLLTSPAPVVEEWDAAVYIQLTSEIADFVRLGKESGRSREAIKEHLGRDAFFNEAQGENAAYRVPDQLARSDRNDNNGTHFVVDAR